MVTKRNRIRTARRANSEAEIDLSRIRRWYDDTQTGTDGTPPASLGTTNIAGGADDSVLQAKYEQLMAEKKALEQKASTLESSLAGAQGYNKTATSKAKQLEAEKQVLAESLQGQLSELESTRDTISSERDTLSEQLATAQQELKTFKGRDSIRKRIPAEDQDLAALFVDTGIMDSLIDVEEEQFTAEWDTLKGRIDTLVNSRSKQRNSGSAPPAPNSQVTRHGTSVADVQDFLMNTGLSGDNDEWANAQDAYLDMLEKQDSA